MHQHVPFKAARTRKGHITEITLETFDSSVYTLMVLAVPAALEILATIRTNKTGRHAVVLWLYIFLHVGVDSDFIETRKIL